MLVDATHGRWLVASVGLLALAGAGYVTWADLPGGPRGSSPAGLFYGGLGAAMILFAVLLGARRKVLLLRVGSMTWWMKGHLWIGLLSLPIVLLHAGFRSGGPLTTVLLALLVAVVALGIVGAALQHALPRVMSSDARGERIYEEIPRRILNRELEAYDIVAEVCGPVPEARRGLVELVPDLAAAVPPPQRGQRVPALFQRVAEATQPIGQRLESVIEVALELAALVPPADRPRVVEEAAKSVVKAWAPVREAAAARPLVEALLGAVEPAERGALALDLFKVFASSSGLADDGLAVVAKLLAGAVPEAARPELERGAEELLKKKRSPARPRPEPKPLDGGQKALREFYIRAVLPFLREPDLGRTLAHRTRAQVIFDGVRASVPEALRAAVADLESACDDVRAMLRQRRLHRILHGWLLLHIPPSLALVVLVIVHAVMALYY